MFHSKTMQVDPLPANLVSIEGREVNEVHESLNNEFFDRDKPVFDAVSSADIDKMIAFAQTYSQFLDAEIAKTKE
ncbi:hypothetical protein H7R52_01765 [Weissella confusa]|uniref:Uncharacterized protein n=1 Tax=Weissella confusa TaxID=1583 RepID=A0A923SSP7_WEICO|nr:hypothetical protein [Weissella confusa]